MRRGRRNGLVALGVAALLAAGVHPALAFGGSERVTVTASTANQFPDAFHAGPGTRAFTDRLGAPPDGGRGALELVTADDGDKVQFVTGEVAGPLERFRSSSYWAIRDPRSASSAMPSFQIALDIDGGQLEADDLHLLTYRPTPARAGTWTRYDVGSGAFCLRKQVGGDDAYRHCVAGERRYTLDEVRAAHPAATAYAAGVNQGVGDGGLTAAVDLIQVGRRTYDLEPD